MRRITKFFKEWYSIPGGMMVGIVAALAVVLALVVGLGHLTLRPFI